MDFDMNAMRTRELGFLKTDHQRSNRDYLRMMDRFANKVESLSDHKDLSKMQLSTEELEKLSQRSKAPKAMQSGMDAIIERWDKYESAQQKTVDQIKKLQEKEFLNPDQEKHLAGLEREYLDRHDNMYKSSAKEINVYNDLTGQKPDPRFTELENRMDNSIAERSSIFSAVMVKPEVFQENTHEIEVSTEIDAHTEHALGDEVENTDALNSAFDRSPDAIDIVAAQDLVSDKDPQSVELADPESTKAPVLEAAAEPVESNLDQPLTPSDRLFDKDDLDLAASRIASNELENSQDITLDKDGLDDIEQGFEPELEADQPIDLAQDNGSLELSDDLATQNMQWDEFIEHDKEIVEHWEMVEETQEGDKHLFDLEDRVVGHVEEMEMIHHQERSQSSEMEQH